MLECRMYQEFKTLISFDTFSNRDGDLLFEFCFDHCSTEALIFLIESGFRTTHHPSTLGKHLQNIPEHSRKNLILAARKIKETPTPLFQLARMVTNQNLNSDIAVQLGYIPTIMKRMLDYE